MPSLTRLPHFFPAILSLVPMAAFVTALQASPGTDPAIGEPLQKAEEHWPPPIVRTQVPEERPEGDPLPADDFAIEPEGQAADPDPVRPLEAESPCDSDERELALHQTVQRAFDRCSETWRWRFQDLRITVSGRPWARDDTGIEIVVTVERPGAPALVSRYPSWVRSGIRLQVGHLDRAGTRYLLLQDYSGGFHCCMNVRLLVVDGPHRRMVPLGSYENPSLLEPYPPDLDGDGYTDFVLQDERYFNRFTAPAPATPPQIWNFRDNRLVDVSSLRGFRGLLFHAARQIRPDCLAEDGSGLLADCPTYLALAARSGQFEHAWEEVMEVCRAAPPHRDDFASALQSFLRETGYIDAALAQAPHDPCGRPSRPDAGPSRQDQHR